MSNTPQPTACLIVIGNEILSGRTQDKNIAWLAEQLNHTGIRLMEVRVIPDVEQVIITTANECRARFTYLFTTGGIGPTHDDITSACIAKAVGRPLLRHPEAVTRLEAHYGDQINEARLKMAEMPEGSSLIDNPVSAAPGFCYENVYVMAGVPRIMQAMFDSIRHQLRGGSPMLSQSYSAYITEGTIAESLTAIQARNAEVEIGSYPFVRYGRLGTSLVVRGLRQEAIDAAGAEIHAMLEALQAEKADEAS